MAIHSNVSLFARDLQLIAKGLHISYYKAITKISFAAYASAQRNSPVLTGRFRSSWAISIGVIGSYSGHSPSEIKNKSGEIRKIRLNSEKGERTNEIKKLRKDPYQNVWIYNNLPYAMRLEKGWSKQKPNGMLNDIELDILAEVDSALSLIMKGPNL